jgi:hypothetical protein
MWTSDENVAIEEFECATFEVIDEDIRAARIKHSKGPNGHGIIKCDHDR